MNQIKIAVLFGGCSSEYSVSLQSAYSVMKELSEEKYQLIPVGITREGEWLRYSGNLERIPEDTWQGPECQSAFLSPDRNIHGIVMVQPDGRTVTERVDVVFPVLHGKNGEDGTVQGLCDLAGIPYVGCGTLSSALCMDKDIAHVVAKEAGVAVPEFVVLQSYMDQEEQQKRCEALPYPVFVKPCRAGSSYGITKVEEPEALAAAIREAFHYDTKVVIEAMIEGFEVGCAVLGNRELIVGEVDEIELQQQGSVFDFHEKYNLETSQIHVPARIDAETAGRIKDTARVLYRALECEGMARVDMFLTPEHEIVFNEINTIPGFTSHSRYPSMMKACGLSFREVLDKLVQAAIETDKTENHPGWSQAAVAWEK